jgi:hypothetical protein
MRALAGPCLCRPTASSCGRPFVPQAFSGIPCSWRCVLGGAKSCVLYGKPFIYTRILVGTFPPQYVGLRRQESGILAKTPRTNGPVAASPPRVRDLPRGERLRLPGLSKASIARNASGGPADRVASCGEVPAVLLERRRTKAPPCFPGRDRHDFESLERQTMMASRPCTARKVSISANHLLTLAALS